MRITMSPSLVHERALAAEGAERIAGVDEAGRGAWAGPVVSAAVILPLTRSTERALAGVTDSKKLTPAQRERFRPAVEKAAIAWAVGMATADEIDAHGILAATRMSMLRAIERLPIQADALLIDAVRLPGVTVPQRAFNFADAISLSVASASIVAKTERDRLMRSLDQRFTGYGFAQHKGYGTRSHAAAIDALGACPIHRHSFQPLLQRRLLT